MNVVDVVYDGEDGPWDVARVAQRGTETLVEYTDDHLARDADLAPVRQPPSDRSRRFPGRRVDHLPGLLADSLPDAWGRSVLRRDMRAHGIEDPTPLQMLTWLGRRTMGALTYRPATGPATPDAALVDLDRVQAEMLRYLEGGVPRDVEADQLTKAAGSGAGGARPKITAAYTTEGELVVDTGTVPAGAAPWLVKFHGTHDTEYLSAVEATYLQMAADAGITTCNHRLLLGSSGTQYLAVERFDRRAVPSGNPRRLHMATAAGLLEAYPEHGQFVGYDHIIRLVRLVTGDTRDVAELVRRAVFNVVAHNRDDHARNFAFLWTRTQGWRLAPAYDLTHSMGPRPEHLADEPGEHYLDIGGKGKRISRDDLHGLARPADVTTAEIDEMVDATLEAVAAWPVLASENGVSDELVELVGTRIPAMGR